MLDISFFFLPKILFDWCFTCHSCQIVTLFFPPAVSFEQLKQSKATKTPKRIGDTFLIAAACGWVKRNILMYSVMKYEQVN